MSTAFIEKLKVRRKTPIREATSLLGLVHERNVVWHIQYGQASHREKTKVYMRLAARFTPQ